MSHVNTHVEKTVFCPSFDTEQGNPGICDSVVLKPFIKEKKPKPSIPLSLFSGSQIIYFSESSFYSVEAVRTWFIWEQEKRREKLMKQKLSITCILFHRWKNLLFVHIKTHSYPRNDLCTYKDNFATAFHIGKRMKIYISHRMLGFVHTHRNVCCGNSLQTPL